MVDTNEVKLAKDRAGKIAVVLMLVSYACGLLTGYEFRQIVDAIIGLVN